jgi:hypothetical protein
MFPEGEFGMEVPGRGWFSVRRPSLGDIEALYPLGTAEIGPGIATPDIVAGVQHHNRDSVWVILHRDKSLAETPVMKGFWAFLMLTEEGVIALKQGELDPLAPDHSLIHVTGIRPAALYIWAIVARRLMAYTLNPIARALGKQIYGGVPLISVAATLGGEQSLVGFGFQPIEPRARPTSPRLFILGQADTAVART